MGTTSQPVFSHEDYRTYLGLLEGAMRYGCNIHAYVLMMNHVHLLVTPETDESLSRMMRYLGSRYVIREPRLPAQWHAMGRALQVKPD